MAAIIDAHNHLHQFANPDALIPEMRAVGMVACVVNGTSEEDWPHVADLAVRHPDFVIPAFGLHPWFAHRRSANWLDSLQHFLDRFPHASIGECGLDGWVEKPSLDVQREVFSAQLGLARERDLPVTIHALKAWQPLFDALAEILPSRFLLHSFGGSRELAERLVKLGAHFSFSGYFLQLRKAKVLEAYRHIPRERLMLETDAPDMLPPPEAITYLLEGDRNHPANLRAIGEHLARHLDCEGEQLFRECTRNTREFFGIRESGSES